jgi:hypothetical protein
MPFFDSLSLFLRERNSSLLNSPIKEKIGGMKENQGSKREGK